MGTEYEWRNAFTERQLLEIAFASSYAKTFHHGTDGHNRLMVIARMSDLLDALEDAGIDVRAIVEKFCALQSAEGE